MAYNDTEDVLKSQHRIAQLERGLAEAKAESKRLLGYDRRPAQVTITIQPEMFAFRDASSTVVALESNLREYSRLIVEQRDAARQERDTLKRLAGELYWAAKYDPDHDIHDDECWILEPELQIKCVCGAEQRFERWGDAIAAYEAATKQEQPR